VKATSHAEHVVGCSASAVIANQRELEDSAGVAALALCLPDNAHIAVHAIPPSAVGQPALLGATQDLRGILLLADPFSMDAAALVAQLEHDYPGVPIMGGLATGNPRLGETMLFHQTDVLSEGAVA